MKKRATLPTMTGVKGNTYMFLYTNICSRRGDVRRVKAYQTRRMSHKLDREISRFFKVLNRKFWLDTQGSLLAFIGWQDGILCEHDVFLDDIGGVKPEIYSYMYSSYDARLENLSFTEILATYIEAKRLGKGFQIKHRRLFEGIKAVLYQYIRCTGWGNRRKLLKILNNKIFETDYDELETAYVNLLALKDRRYE